MGRPVQHPGLKQHRALSADVLWIALHFAFVASLAAVYVRREAWTLEERPPLPEVLKGCFGRRTVRRRITREGLLQALRVHDMEKQGLDALDFSPDGSQALARDEKSDELVIYDLEARKEISRPMPAERVGAASYLPDGKGVLLVDFCGRWIGGWDAASHRLDYRLRIAGNTWMYLSVSPAGRFAIAADDSGGKAFLLDVPGRRVVRTLDLGRWDGVERGSNSTFAAWFSPDGSRIAALTPNRGVRLWDGTTGRLVRNYEAELSFNMEGTSFCFSPDGTRMAAGSRDNTIVADARNGRVLAKLGSPRGRSEMIPVRPAQCVLKNDALLVGGLRWRRRRPEWWWGHFYRPEVWVAAALGVIWLWSVARYLRRRLRERAGAAA